jgi:hypothetical protein
MAIVRIIAKYNKDGSTSIKRAQEKINDETIIDCLNCHNCPAGYNSFYEKCVHAGRKPLKGDGGCSRLGTDPDNGTGLGHSDTIL